MSVEQELEWLTNAVGLYRCSDRAVLAVTGDDARTWLQGQVTNDLNASQPGDVTYAFVLTQKGRVLADLWVIDREEELWLLVPRGQLDALVPRLERYIIMEDVELELREDWIVVTAQGPVAEKLEAAGFHTDRLGRGGRDFVLRGADPERELDELRQRCAALGGGEVGEEAWAKAHILSGRPRFGVDFGESTYPQESGLAKLAVSFTKGCYLGQETVMMLQSRGKAPKTLWRWRVAAGSPPAAKSPIRFGEVSVGEVTSAVEDGADSLALGYLKRGHEIGEAESISVGGFPAEALGSVEELL